MHGFYLARDGERWCTELADWIEQTRPQVIYGNHDAVVRELNELSATQQAITDWAAGLD